MLDDVPRCRMSQTPEFRDHRVVIIVNTAMFNFVSGCSSAQHHITCPQVGRQGIRNASGVDEPPTVYKSIHRAMSVPCEDEFRWACGDQGVQLLV